MKAVTMLLAGCVAATLLRARAAAAELAAIELTCVDDAATGFGTFQSHNQKAVANRRGIFMTHIRTRNEAYTAQQWRLSWSRDGGKSFATLYEATHATNPPVIESDAHDNLYLVRADFIDGDAYLYRFLAADDYRQPLVSRIPGGAAGKFSMALDAQRGQLHYFAHNDSLHRIALSGEVRSRIDLLCPGRVALLQYPLLSLDSAGVLHAAWTTQQHGNYLYWDIRYLQSADGGASWTTMAGEPAALPAIADEGGPADRITLADENEVHTWLANFLVRDGHAHFLYLAQADPPRQHYVRYDLATARRAVDLQPEFRGETLSLRSLDGFFATRAAQPQSPLYVVARDAAASRLACLVSRDNGATWHDHAVSPEVANPYSIGGCREIAPDGSIIGSFTEQRGATTDPGGQSRVHFFRIPADPRAADAAGRP